MNFDEIEVIPIELDVKFTSDQHLNCLFFQPKIELEKEYGFERYIINERENHFDKIKHLMALSNNNQSNGLSKDIHFILLPEYAIAGTDQVKFILDEMKKSPISEQVLIGGIDGLTLVEFKDLLRNTSFEDVVRTYMLDWVDSIPPNKWVNTSIIIQKKNDEITYYLQPKLSSSPEGEILNELLNGKWILFFSTASKINKFNFFCSLCYDWIAKNQHQRLIDQIPQKLNSVTNNDEYCVAFVPQFNPRPDHPDFLLATKHYLTNSGDWRRFHGTRSIVMMINSAVNGSHYGNSSIIINNGKYKCGNDPLPTYSIIRKGMDSFTNVVFRNQTECIHAVELVLPFSTRINSGSERYPCIQAIIHTIDGQEIINDPRYPIPPKCVCGYRKIINDYLDEANTDLKKCLTGSDLNDEEKGKWVDNHFDLIIDLRSNILKENAKSIIEHMYLNSKYYVNCDNWLFKREGFSFSRLVRILSLFRMIEYKVLIPKLLHGCIHLITMKYSLLYLAKENYSINHTHNPRVLKQYIEDLVMENECKELIIITEDKIKNNIFGYLNPPGEFGAFTNTNPIITNFNNLENNIKNMRSIEELKEAIIIELGGRENAI